MLSLEIVLLSLHVQCFSLEYYKINDLNNSLCKYLKDITTIMILKSVYFVI